MAKKKLRTIGLRVVRELERKLPLERQKQYEREFSNYKKFSLRSEKVKTKSKVYMSHKQLVLPKEKLISLMNLQQK